MTPEPTPLVSVLTTCYNRERYLPAAIDSVLASSLRDFELIIVDDGSRDGSVDIARSYAARDPRIQVHVNEQNLGDYPNRNRAAALARGRYLKYLDSDDVLYPFALEGMVGMMENFPHAALGLSRVQYPERPMPVLLSPREAYEDAFFHGGDYIFGRAPGSAILRTDVFRELGGFSGIRQVGDHEMWLLMARHHPVLALPPVFYWSRVHGEQELAYDRQAEKMKMHFEIQRRALEHPDCPLAPERRQAALARLRSIQARSIAQHLRRGRIGAAMEIKNLLDVPWSNVVGLLRTLGDTRPH
ncbi:MAG: glycosyltransferase family 2 protein [Magnetococcus sp. WYHC-3]